MSTAVDAEVRDPARGGRASVQIRQVTLAIGAAVVTGLVMGAATAVAGRWG